MKQRAYLPLPLRALNSVREGPSLVDYLIPSTWHRAWSKAAAPRLFLEWMSKLSKVTQPESGTATVLWMTLNRSSSPCELREESRIWSKVVWKVLWSLRHSRMPRKGLFNNTLITTHLMGNYSIILLFPGSAPPSVNTELWAEWISADSDTHWLCCRGHRQNHVQGDPLLPPATTVRWTRIPARQSIRCQSEGLSERVLLLCTKPVGVYNKVGGGIDQFISLSSGMVLPSTVVFSVFTTGIPMF